MLHRILSECTRIYMHPVKELHYYDSLFKVRDVRLLKMFSLKQLNSEWDRMIAAEDFGYIDKRYKCYIRANKMLWLRPIDTIDYVDLFRPALSENTHFGEITPEYMILPEEGVRKMHDDLGSETRIVLVARNPVRRFVSAFKLLRLYNDQPYDMGKFSDDLAETLDSMPDWISQQDRLSDYESSLRTFRKYFRNVLFISYDQLVADPERTHKQLEKFLELDVDKAAYLRLLNQNINSIGETGQIRRDTEMLLQRRYERFSRFLSDCFGKNGCVL